MKYGITPVFYKNYQALKAKGPDGKRKYKYIINTGGSRSSKTWSLLELMHQIAEHNPEHRITIWRESKELCRATLWQDYQKILRITGRLVTEQRNKQLAAYTFANGSNLEFIGTDDEEKVHGLTQQVAWLNEPYKTSKETFDQIDQRADLIFIDWNPKKKSWINDLAKLPNAIVIHSTYADNPFCPEQSRIKIESYDPDNPINVANGTSDPYMWAVYGLGTMAEKPDRVFNWPTCTLEFYRSQNLTPLYGVDWGRVDPWGVLEAKYYDGTLYLHQINYMSESGWEAKLPKAEMEAIRASGTEGLVQAVWRKFGIDKNRDIICDDNRPNKIEALRAAGWENAIRAKKPQGSIADGVELLLSLNVVITETSSDLIAEAENYSRKTDRQGVLIDEYLDADNHLIDPARYVAQFLRDIGVIRKG